MALNLRSRKFSSETNSLLSLLVVLTTLIILAFLSENYFHFRLDLTESKEYTLNKASVQTLSNLPDPVKIKVVISSELPTQFVQIKTRVTDLLNEFEASAKGKVEVELLNPGLNEDNKKQALQLGIQEVQMQEQSRQGVEVKKGFFGLALTYGDKKEVIPILANIENFEYDLIVKIKKLTGQIKTLAVFEGGPGRQFSFSLPGNPPQTRIGFNDNFPATKTELEKLYNIQNTDLSNPLDTNIDLLMVVAPTQMTEVEKFHLDQFVMRGKSVLFMTPGINVSLAMGLQASPAQNGYEDLLKTYGLGVQPNVILEDRQFQDVPFGGSFFPVPYPYWIVVAGKGLSNKSAITSNLGALALPWTSSIEVDPSDKSIEVLATSTPGSWSEQGNFNLAPRELGQYVPVAQKTHPLAVIKTGTFKSAFATQVPSDTLLRPYLTSLLTQSQKESRILLIGNVLFATDFYLSLMRTAPNMGFLLNAVDQLALGPELIKIRSRTLENRTIPESFKEKKIWVVLANMLTAPFILLGIGIFLGIRRKNRDAQT